METMLQDVRFAFRTLRKSPAFTAIAVVCLALGIATNTTLFSVFDAVLVKPFPFQDPTRLVSLWEKNPKNGNRYSVSYLNFLDWRAQATTLSDIAAYAGRSIAITEGDEPERLQGELVSGNLFPMLGIVPQIGRLIRADEDKAGAAGVVLLSDGLWRRRYLSDSTVLGRVISINNLPYTVIGVMPPRFQFPQNAQIWLPIAPMLHDDARDVRSVSMVGRLKPGASIAQADREIAVIDANLNQQYGIITKGWVGSASDMRKDFIPPDVSLIVATMFGAVTFVLLIAVANVANLMLTRAAGRSREIAIRVAIGAGRGRIVRQLLTESVMLAVAAGLVAIPITWEALRLLDFAMPAEAPLPYYIHWSLDFRTLLYTGAISLATGMAFGLAPALQSARGTLTESLKDGSRGGGTRKNRVRSTLVVAEVALSLVLLVGASLFVRSFAALQATKVGFDTTPILSMRFFLSGTRYDSTITKAQQVAEIIRRVEALPGVEAAAVSNLIPIDGGGAGDGVIIEGVPVDKGKEPPIFWSGVGGHWFETLGVGMAAGRTLSADDARDTIPVAVINKTMAVKFWKDASAIGHRFRFASDSSQRWFTIIGISPDIRTDRLSDTGEMQPSAYVPYRFLPVRNHGLMVRVRAGQAVTSVTSAVRGAVRAADPSIPVWNVRSMEKVRELSFWQYGLFGMMFGVFGAIALFLAAIGVYGVISYGVSQRTREIGLRVALGAQQRDVIGLVVWQGMSLAAVGIGLGLAGAFGVTRVVSSMLIGVSPTDAVSFVGVASFLALVAFIASFIPARRATGVDPIIALRAE
jgi:putative ABC transport system permease protein